MIRNTQKIGIHGQIDLRWTHFDGDYPIFKFRIGDSRGRIILEGEDSGTGRKMPDASKSMHSLVTDLLDAADRWEPEAPGWLYDGYIPSAVAEWAHDARDDLVAVRGALVPIMAMEL